MTDVRIFGSYDEMSVFAADYVARKIDEDPSLVMCLPTGGTPEGMYENLVRMYKRGKVNFSGVSILNMDEYCGLGRWDPQSYQYYFHEKLLDHVNVKSENVYMFDGCSADPTKSCADREELIEDLGGIGLTVGGAGRDDHVAFNMRGSRFDSRTRVVRLSEQTIADNCRYFLGVSESVPKYAMTIGIGTLLDSREVMLLANGTHKSAAVRRAIMENPSEECPASALQLHARSLWALDEAAASELLVSATPS